MTATAIERTAPAPVVERLGQATAVEQSRAVAEVQAAVYVAQQYPRDVQQAIADMRMSCTQKGLAERAFYQFPRAGGSVSGKSVHLARELARCWGNVQYGLSELRRDDDHGQSEMLAFAWDVQTNARNSHTFIVPHKRDKKTGVEALTDLRDIYENNANNGARRVRESIFAILPSWFVEDAADLCRKTLIDGGGVPLPKRIASAIDVFAEMGVTVDQLERRINRPNAKWTAGDLATLIIIGKSLRAGEVRVEEEFPEEVVTVAEIKRAGAPKPAPKTVEPQVASSDDAVSDDVWPDTAGPGDEDRSV